MVRHPQTLPHLRALEEAKLFFLVLSPKWSQSCPGEFERTFQPLHLHDEAWRVSLGVLKLREPPASHEFLPVQLLLPPSMLQRRWMFPSLYPLILPSLAPMLAAHVSLLFVSEVPQHASRPFLLFVTPDPDAGFLLQRSEKLMSLALRIVIFCQPSTRIVSPCIQKSLRGRSWLVSRTVSGKILALHQSNACGLRMESSLLCLYEQQRKNISTFAVGFVRSFFANKAR